MFYVSKRLSTHNLTCFTYDYQVVRPSLWGGRVLRIKTHLDSKLEHGNVGQLLWKHRISRAILRRGPSQDEAEAIRPPCFTYQNTCQLIFLCVLRVITKRCARAYGTVVFYVSKRTSTQNWNMVM